MVPDHPVPDPISTIFKVPLFVLIALVSLLMALLTRQSQMTLLLLLVLGVMTLTKLWSLSAFARMGFDLKIDRTRIFPGEEIVFEVAARNQKFLPVWLQVSMPLDLPCFVSPASACENVFLLGFQKTKFAWNLKFHHRGCFFLGHPNILAGDVFGFFPRGQIRQETMEVIVYPKPRGIRPFLMPPHYVFGVPGSRSPVQDPVYLMGTREYQGFTPVKFIHWKASARYGKLQEKICEPSVQEKILIVVDVDLFHLHQAKGDFELMLEAAAAMAVNFEARGCAVGFMTNGAIKGGKPGIVPVIRTPQTLSMILETLARMEMKPCAQILEMLQGQKFWGISSVFCTHSLDLSGVKIQQFYAQKRISVKYFVSTVNHTQTDSRVKDIHPLETLWI